MFASSSFPHVRSSTRGFLLLALELLRYFFFENCFILERVSVVVSPCGRLFDEDKYHGKR